jgi:hypothetical protein
VGRPYRYLLRSWLPSWHYLRLMAKYKARNPERQARNDKARKLDEQRREQMRKDTEAENARIQKQVKEMQDKLMKEQQERNKRR